MNHAEITGLIQTLLPESEEQSSVYNKLVPFAQTISLVKKEPIVLDNLIQDRLFLIQKGLIMQRYSNQDITRASNFFFEKSVFSVSPHIQQLPLFSYHFIALEPTYLISWDYKQLRKNLPEELLNKLVVGWFRQYYLPENSFKHQVIMLPPVKLYQYLVDQKPEIIQRVPQKYIAEFMGISPEHLSRIRKKII